MVEPMKHTVSFAVEGHSALDIEQQARKMLARYVGVDHVNWRIQVHATPLYAVGGDAEIAMWAGNVDAQRVRR